MENAVGDAVPRTAITPSILSGLSVDLAEPRPVPSWFTWSTADPDASPVIVRLLDAPSWFGAKLALIAIAPPSPVKLPPTVSVLSVPVAFVTRLSVPPDETVTFPVRLLEYPAMSTVSDARSPITVSSQPLSAKTVPIVAV